MLPTSGTRGKERQRDRKEQKVMGRAKDLVKRVAEAVTPGDENREYFSNLIKETNERSVKGALRKYFNNLLKESNERSTQSLIRRRHTAMIKDSLVVAIHQAREGVGEVDDP